jgi:WD40 repeat protein
MKAAARPNPFVGPRAFKTGETLFGRDREVRELLDLLIAERIVLLHSPSGAGKSSLINAGLLPLLKAEGFVLPPVIRVGQAIEAGTAGSGNRHVLSALLSLEEAFERNEQMPRAELAGLSLEIYLDRRGLGEPGANLVLVLDQFEELLTVDPANRFSKQEFFSQLGAALRNRSRWALIAMREDYVASLAPYLRPLPTRLNTTYRLDLLGIDAALQAIRRPAADHGVNFTEEAARRLVDDLRRIQVQRPDGTMEEQLGPHVEPVQLQVVCYRLWQSLRPGESEVTLPRVEKLGDVSASLRAYYAERVQTAAAESRVDERAIRDWFEHQLITETNIRGQVLMGEQSSEGLDNRAIRLLENAYLVRAEKRRGATWFELSHDRLIQPVRQDNAQWYEKNLGLLQRSAVVWEANYRSDDLLLRGKALLAAEHWAHAYPAQVRPLEGELLRASVAARRREEEQEQEEQRRQEMERRLADEQAQRYLKEAQTAKLETELEIEKTMNAQKLLAEQTLRIVEQTQRIAETTAYQQQLEGSARRLRIYLVLTGVIALIAVTLAFIAFNAQSQANTRAEENVVLATKGANSEFAAATALNQARIEGQRAATAQAGSLKHAATAVAARLEAQRQATEAAASRKEALGAARDAEIARLEAQQSLNEYRQALSRQLAAQAGGLLAVNPSLAALLGIESYRFGPSGPSYAFLLRRQLALSRQDLQAAGAGLVFQRFGRSPGVQGSELLSLAFSDDGRYLAWGNILGDVTLWSISEQRIISRFTEHGDAVRALAFTPDGRYLVSGGRDARIYFHDLQTGAALLVKSKNIVLSLAISPDSRRMATGGVVSLDFRDVIGGGIALDFWDLTTLLDKPESQRVELRRTQGHTDIIYDLAFSPDGQYLASASADQSVRVWDTALMETVYTFNGHRSTVLGLAWSPDNTLLASAGDDKDIILWDMERGRMAQKITNAHGNNAVYDVAFSPTGNLLASAGADNNVHIWDATDRQPLAVLSELEGAPLHTQNARMVAFTIAGGRLLLLTGGTASTWWRCAVQSRSTVRWTRRSPSPPAIPRWRQAPSPAPPGWMCVWPSACKRRATDPASSYTTTPPRLAERRR